MAPPRSWKFMGQGIVVVTLAVFSAVRWLPSEHPGGDPNGTVLNTMKRSVQAALPAHAADVRIQASEPQWEIVGQGCDDPNTRDGWDEAIASVMFSDSDSSTVIDRQIAQALARSGWTSEPMRITRGQGFVPHWLRGVRGDRPINAYAYATPSGSDSWVLTASWQPPGPVGQGCP